MSNIISKPAKEFAIELKKKMHVIFESNHKSFENFTLIYHITNAKIDFTILYDFTLDTYVPSIVESIQKFFQVFGLEAEYSLNFHYNTQVIASCCHPFYTEIYIFKKNFKGIEWSPNDSKTIKSFAFSV